MGKLHILGNDEEDNMKLSAKINSKYLDKILSGEKKMEFRQFDGTDKMEVTDENGRTVTLRIISCHEASPELEGAVRREHSEIAWKETEPIMVFKVCTT